MKKVFTILLLFMATIGAQAQFESGKIYSSLSLDGIDFSYQSKDGFKIGVSGSAGVFVLDNWLAKTTLGYEHTKHYDNLRVGLGVDHYFQRNGIFVGLGAEYNHFTPKNNDILIPVEVGYAFFINRFITIEPKFYFKPAIFDFKDNTQVGLSIGFGFYN